MKKSRKVKFVNSLKITYTPDWSRISNAAGYPIVYCPDHPRAWPLGYVYAHRVVAEQKLGRLLKENEIVHHINEDKSDYSPDNLKVVESEAEHKKFHLVEVVMVTGNCSWCGKSFSRPKRKQGEMKYCGHSCNGKAQRAAQMESGTNVGSTTINHGTAVAYSYRGCRCPICKEAHALRHVDYMARKRAGKIMVTGRPK